jgi:signal transduction histidine kinase
MFTGLSLVLLIISLIGALLLLSWLGQRTSFSTIQKQWLYSLSLGIHCTSWAMFGTVTQANEFGWPLVPTYAGIILTMLFGFRLVQKVSHLTLVNNLGSIADVFALRFKAQFLLTGLIALVCLIGVVPYISLQLDAISDALKLLWPQSELVGSVPSTVALSMLGLALFYGGRKGRTELRDVGLVFTVAITSVIKLACLLAVFVYVVWGLFDGPLDLFIRATQHPTTLTTLSQTSAWPIFMSHIFLGVVSLFCLPRQFHMMFVEQPDQQSIHNARYVFPAYLLCMSVPILPIALAGEILLGGTNIQSDLYTLALPYTTGSISISIIALIGGLCAAFVMILVATHALSQMVANHIFTPLWLRLSLEVKQQHSAFVFNARTIVWLRRFTITSTLLLAYFYYASFSQNTTLVNTGFIALALIAQIFPSLLLILYQPKVSLFAPICAIVSGLIVWLVTLLYPNLIAIYYFANPLEPTSLAQNLALSIIVNTSVFLLVNSLAINVFKRSYSRLGDLQTTQDIIAVQHLKSICQNILPERTMHSLFHEVTTLMVDTTLLKRCRRELTGVIGTPSTNLLLSSLTENSQNVDELMQWVSETKYDIAAEFVQEKQALESAKQTAEAQNQQKTQFLAAAGHDLMQPFNAAQLLASILAEKSENTELAQLSLELKGALNHAEDLLKMLLEVSRLESGKIAPKIAPCRLRDITHHLMDEFGIIAQQHNVKLRCFVPEIWVKTDHLLLSRILQNLIANAIRYTATIQHARKIVLFGVRRGPANTYKLCIYDTGPGIPEQEQQRIFEEFTQLTNKHGEKGLGLGLSIVDKLSTLLNHPLILHSVVNQGSVFSVSVPRANAMAKDALFPATALYNTQPKTPRTGSDLQVLLVENDIRVANAMSELFEHWQIALTCISDPASCLTTLAQGEVYDLVILDYHLDQNQTGTELWRQIKTNFSKQVGQGVLITADRRQILRDEAQDLGLYYLPKPIKPAILKRFIHRHSNIVLV